ncbi:MAG: dockerin type I domain-containing protein, partial [Pirellulales bacterium]
LGAFSVRAWDGTVASADSVAVTVSVAAVNDPPSLSTISVLPGGVEDQDFAISYETLLAASDAWDLDGDAVSFRIESVSSGTLTFSPGRLLLGPGSQVVWHPEANAHGTLPVFTVSVWDGHAASAGEVQVLAIVAAVNDAPVMSTVSAFTDVQSEQDLTITYEILAQGADASDVDGDAIRFLVDRINSGTLSKNGAPAVAGVTYLAAGENLVWHPAPGSAGTMNMFNIRAWDGQAHSTPSLSVRAILELKGDADHDGMVNIFDVAQLQQYYGTISGASWRKGDFNGDGHVDIFDVALLQTNYGRSVGNNAPTLSAIDPLAGAVDNEDYTITYASLTAAANVADINGDPLAFRIESVDAGILTKDGMIVTPGTTLLAEGESLVWRSAPNALGTIGAFSVVAWDGEFTSAPAVAVQIQVTPATPRVVAMAPMPGTTVGSGLGTLRLSFSQALDLATVISSSFQILGSGGDGTFADGNEVPVGIAAVYWDAVSDTVVIDPVSYFPVDTYQLTATDNLRGVGGRQLDGDFAGDFPTGDGLPGGNFTATFDIIAGHMSSAEYMLGDVYVTVVLLESNGGIDPNTENWTQSQIDRVKSKVLEGLSWWEDTLRTYNATAPLHFIADFTYADFPVSTGYEPINRSAATEDGLWIDDFLSTVGHNTSASYADDMRWFNYDQRTAHDTDWATTVFVVNSANDTDGKFRDNYFAYTYDLGGPYVMMTYDNDGWGISHMGQVLAHELGHVFYALDEYPNSSSGWYNYRSGYYAAQNLNAYDGNPAPATRVPSIMAEVSLQNAAWASHVTSPSSRAMIGWKDSDADGIFDVLDVPLYLSGMGTYDAAAKEYEFTGYSIAQPLRNLNPYGYHEDITINRVDAAQYRVDSGAWFTFYLNYGGSPAASIHGYLGPFANGTHTIQVRTIDNRSGVTSSLFTDTITVGVASAPPAPSETAVGVAESPAGFEPAPPAEAVLTDPAAGVFDSGKTPLDAASLTKGAALAPVAPWTRSLLDDAVFAPLAEPLARRRGKLPTSWLGPEPVFRKRLAAEAGWEMAVDRLVASTEFDPTGPEDGAVL